MTVYSYLTNVKGFFLFMCESCESKIPFFFSFFLFTVTRLFISQCVSGNFTELCDLSLFM